MNAASAGASANPPWKGRKTFDKIEIVPEVDNSITPVLTLSPAKKIKLADRMELSVPAGPSASLGAELTKPLVDAEVSEDESPPFCPLPDRKVPSKGALKDDITPVTTKSKPVKTSKRKNKIEESSQPSQPTEEDSVEVKQSPVKKGKRNPKKNEKEEPKEVKKVKEVKEVKSAEKEKESSSKAVEASEEKKKPRGRKPKVRAEEESEELTEARTEVQEEPVVEAAVGGARPRRNCKKKFDSLADLASSSNPNSPAIPEVKKRGRPKSTAKPEPVEVEPPTKENSPEVPAAVAEPKAKAAPSKRGRKPGKKAGADADTGATSDPTGAVALPDMISKEGISSPKPEPKPPAKRGRPKKVKN